jgi:hypothetical protein
MIEIREPANWYSSHTVLLNDRKVGSIRNEDGLFEVMLWKNSQELDAMETFGSFESAKKFVLEFYEMEFPEFIEG